MENQKLLTKKEIIPITIILAMVAIGIIFFSKMPQMIPSHWNFQGEIDSYMRRDVFIFLIPGISIGVYLLMTFLPFIDPLKRNVQKFASAYVWMKTIIVGFLALLFFLITYISVSGKFNFPVGIAVTLSVGAMMMLMGRIMPLIKRNYFIGIRTPWTIDSEEVWDATHKRARCAFTLGGAIMIIGGLFEVITFWFFIIAILTLLWPVADSYFIHRKIARKINE